MPHFSEIKNLSKEIRSHFFNSKLTRVRGVALGTAVQGNLWKAVKVAKNLNIDSIPSNLTLDGIPIATHETANAFAKFFNEKVMSHANNTKVDPGVYNGKNKLIVPDKNFMQYNDVKECMLTLKNKRCEGYDRIPVCILADARENLYDPLAQLFSKIFFKLNMKRTK